MLVAGWRYGRAAAFGQPTETWAARALGFAVAIGLALWGAYVVACVVFQLGAPGIGSANLAPFIGFAAFESSVYVLLGTVFVTIPLGCLRLLWKDVRLLGALTALGLDVLWLAMSVLLAAASVWFVAFPLFGSITGLVVAPLWVTLLRLFGPSAGPPPSAL